MLKPYYVLLTDSQYIMGGLRMVICPCLIGVVRTEVGEGNPLIITCCTTIQLVGC